MISDRFALLLDPGALFQTLVEVHDPVSGTVLARHEYLDSTVLQVLDEDHVMTHRLTSDGERIIRIVRFTLEGG